MAHRAPKPQNLRMSTTEHLRSSPLFTGVSHQALRQIAATLTTQQWPESRRIAEPRETAQRFWIILGGHVKIVRSNSDGRELILWLLGPGDGFDCASLLDGQSHAISAWSVGPVTTASAPLRDFRRWLELYPPMRLAVHRYVAGKLRELSELASDLALHDTSTRLAIVLLNHLEPGPTRWHNRVDPLNDLTQEELASLIGTVRVVVSRAVAQLRRDGILATRDGRLRVASLKRLMLRAQGRLEGGRTKRPRDKTACG